MSETKINHEPKYPVGSKKSAREVQEQMGRITSGLAARVGKLKHKGNLSSHYGNGRVEVELSTATEDGNRKRINADLSSGGWRGTSHLTREIGEDESTSKLDVSSVSADTMHGWIFKGKVTDPENGVQQLTGTEAVHHAAKNFAELRSAVANQEVTSQQQIAQDATTNQQAKQATLEKLYK